MTIDQHHKIFLCHAPKYEDGFEDFKKGVRYLSLEIFYLWSYFFAFFSGVTERFQKISLEIIEIKKGLREQEPPRTQAALMIEKVQVTHISLEDLFF